MSSNIYKIEILEEWVQICLSDKAYPIEVSISIDKKGRHSIVQQVDGRQLRGRFILWMANQFFITTNIKPPKNKSNSAFNKTWVMPMEALLRQAVYIGGVDYDNLKPKDKYIALHGICWTLILQDTVARQRDANLTIAMPASIAKVGADVVAQGNHYRRALVKYENELEKRKL